MFSLTVVCRRHDPRRTPRRTPRELVARSRRLSACARALSGSDAEPGVQQIFRVQRHDHRDLRAESCRSRQEGVADPRPVRGQRHPAGRRCVRGEYSRQHPAATDGQRDPGGEVPTRSAPSQTRNAARRQALRLRQAPPVAARRGNSSTHRPPRNREERPAEPVPVEDRTHHVPGSPATDA